jgi:hypothetical protein
MDADNSAARLAPHDADWRGRHSQLDAALTAAIRAPAVDERFDEQVWALIRADEAEALAMQDLLRMRLGAPWWLDSLNVIAIAVTVVGVALALGASRPAAEAVAVASAFLEQPSESVRAVTLAAAAAALWLGLRQVPLVRALVRAWL